MFSSEARIRDSRWREPVRRIEAAALGLFWLGARALPPRRAARTGARLFAWLGPRLRKQDFVRSNLARLFPAAGPARIEALEAEQAQISATLAGTEIYVNEPKRVAELQARFAQIDEALLAAMERWETLGAR